MIARFVWLRRPDAGAAAGGASAAASKSNQFYSFDLSSNGERFESRTSACSDDVEAFWEAACLSQQFDVVLWRDSLCLARIAQGEYGRHTRSRRHSRR